MTIDLGIIGAPLVAGLLVLATHVPLGRRVLERGIIFIDLTIAQVAALGAIAASLFGLAEGWQEQLAAGAAALLAAGALAGAERRLPHLQEALIGSLYVLAASLAVLLVAHHPHGAEHFEELLAGQILWIRGDQLGWLAAGSVALLGLWTFWGRYSTVGFYFIFALAVMLSVRVIGVFLVFATLILPALAAHGLGARQGLVTAYALGAAGYGLGLWLSVPLDVPAGPMVVCTLSALVAAAALARAAWRR